MNVYMDIVFQMFLDQVAQFIIKNTQGASLGSQGANVDPYTGMYILQCWDLFYFNVF